MQPELDLVPNWERIEGEPEHWFQRFWEFARPLGAEYTLKRAYRMYIAKNPGCVQDIELWQEMSAKYNWYKRACEWFEQDRFIRTQMWQQRRETLLNADWDTGSALRSLAQQFLEKIELTKEVSHIVNEEGQEVITLALNVTPRDLSTLIKTASDLQRLGVGEPTSISGQAQPGVGIYLPEIKEREKENG